MREVDAAVSASERADEPDRVSGDPITTMLRSLASVSRDVAPWVPYWRLKGMGGNLRWTCPLDNRSVPERALTTRRPTLAARGSSRHGCIPAQWAGDFSGSDKNRLSVADKERREAASLGGAGSSVVAAANPATAAWPTASGARVAAGDIGAWVRD